MDGFSTMKRFIPITISLGALAVILYNVWRKSKDRLKNGLLKFRSQCSKEIVIVSSVGEWEAVYPTLVEKCSGIKAVGFDCEWVFWGKRLPVAVVQIATFDGYCLLVRIFKFKCIPVTLKQFLGDKSILKVGVASKDDGKKLVSDYGIPVVGCVDLRYILARVPAFKCGGMSLANIGEVVLDVSMTKDREIRCGDWEAEPLSQQQISYAADDALIAIDAFMKLLAVKITHMETSQTYYGSEIRVTEELFWRRARSLCQGVVDMVYKGRRMRSLVQETADDSSEGESDEQENGHLPMYGNKSGKMNKQSTKAFMTRKRPLYYNCQLLAPDGQCLTLCDIRKAEWYISKGLGVKVSDDPVTVQLKFEPKNRPSSQQDYYLQDKRNICVVCGVSEDYVRKLVVPQEYRKYFPTLLKDHSSHDVLLLCISCHLKCGDYEGSLRHMLAVECAAPLDAGKDTKQRLDQDFAKVVSAAKALQKSRHKIPPARVTVLEDIVKNFYGIQNLTEEWLEQALSIETSIQNTTYVPHGKKVVDFYMEKDGGLIEFEKLWRRQFVEYMQPKFLPPLWSIEHDPERLKPVLNLHDDSASDDDSILINDDIVYSD